MIVIADSNIFYSALIAPNGEIANILRDKNMQFIAPDFIIDEVKEHLDIIEASRKKDKTKKKILADLNYLLEKITIISLDKIDKEYLQEAFTIVKDIDRRLPLYRLAPTNKTQDLVKRPSSYQWAHS